MTEKSLNILRTAGFGLPSPTRRKVIAEDFVRQLSYKFDCIAHGGEFFKVNRTAVSQNLAKRSKTCAGMRWRYAEAKV